MTKDRTTISGPQFAFTIIIYMQAASLLKGLYFIIAGHDSWLFFMQSMILHIPILLTIFALVKRFPEKTLLEILDTVFGKTAGKILSFLYLLYFLTTCTVNLRNVGIFTQNTILPQTPVFLTSMLLIGISAYAVRYGIDVVTRGNSLFGILVIVIILISILLMSNIMHLENFLPVFDVGVKDYFSNLPLNLSVPFGDLILFMMITPKVRCKPKKLCKHFLIGFIIAALLFLLALVRDIAVLGNTIEMFAESSYEALRLINLASTISHLEILYSIIFLLLMFAKITFIFYCVVIAFAQIFNVKRYQNYIISLAVLIVVYSMIVYKNQTEYLNSAINLVPFYFILFEHLLPIVLLVVALIKKPYKRRLLA